MAWLATVIRVTIAPVLLGAFAVVKHSERGPTDIAAVVGLLVLSAIHVTFWSDPWRRTQLQSVAAVVTMIVVNFILLNLLSLSEPLLWLYPALIGGAGLRTRVAVVAIGLTALAAAAPLALQGRLVQRPSSPRPQQRSIPRGSRC